MFTTLPQSGPYRQISAGRFSQDCEVIRRRLHHAEQAGVIRDLNVSSTLSDTHISFTFAWGRPYSEWRTSSEFWDRNVD